MESNGLDQTFGDLFGLLAEQDYYWEPQTPDRLIAYRRDAEAFDPWVRCFGLGEAPVPEAVPSRLADQLAELRPAISRCGPHYVAHHHWGDGQRREDFVYFGLESMRLLGCLDPENLRGRNVLDLGSGSGALAFALAAHAREIRGLELSPTAVAWAQAAARAQALQNVSFAQARIGDPASDHAASKPRQGVWDAAIFNPPFALPCGADRPARDGGRLGIELPLAFVDFAHKHLAPGSPAHCLVTNPIVGGQGLFFEELARRPWRIEERRCLDPRFNRALYRKEGYAEQGIERVELWYLEISRI